MKISLYLHGFWISLLICRTKYRHGQEHLRLLVDPVELAVLVANDLTLLEPESDFLLGVLDAVGAVADVAADILFMLVGGNGATYIRFTHNGVVTTDGARGGGKRVGGTKNGCKCERSSSGQSIDG